MQRDIDELKEVAMNSNPIKTKADYRATLSEIETLMGAKANSADGERLDILVTLVEAYERKHLNRVSPVLVLPTKDQYTSS